MCRKKLANEWKIRLLKEFESTPTHRHFGKIQPRIVFVSLTFSPKYYSDDDSFFASYLVKMRDNWRKRFGKSPRYFATTDRGAKNGRLHLHMLLFNPYDYIKNKPISVTTIESFKLWWKYGYTQFRWVEKGCQAAIYCVGYITGANIQKDAEEVRKHGHKVCEIALKHKPRIFVSKGLGSAFDTYENFLQFKYSGPTLNIGDYVYVLPRYYRYKWWSRYERFTEYLVRYYETYDLATRYGVDSDIVDLFGGVEKFEQQLQTGFLESTIPLKLGKHIIQNYDIYVGLRKDISRFDTSEKEKWVCPPPESMPFSPDSDWCFGKFDWLNYDNYDFDSEFPY